MARWGPHTFLNNVSLGIYGEAVRSPACRDAEVRTLLQTVAEVMGPSAEAPALRLVTAGTKDNVITLTGPRPHLAEYGAVLGAAWMARGVIDVRDELQVTG
jgi:hypothetical protein